MTVILDLFSCHVGTEINFKGIFRLPWASLVAQLVKNPPTMQETWVWSLGWEDPLERERLPTPVFWPGEFQGQSMGSQTVRHDWATFTYTALVTNDPQKNWRSCHRGGQDAAENREPCISLVASWQLCTQGPGDFPLHSSFGGICKGKGVLWHLSSRTLICQRSIPEWHRASALRPMRSRAEGSNTQLWGFGSLSVGCSPLVTRHVCIWWDFESTQQRNLSFHP